jgi:hypothetical protein
MQVGERELNELGQLWRSQAPGSEAWDTAETLAHVRRTSWKLDRAVFWRNVREAGAGVLVIGAIGWTSWLAPGWAPKLGAAIAAASVVFVLLRLARERREHPPARPDVPLSDWLEGELRRVAAEARLLRSVRSWYVAPLALGATFWGVILVSQGLLSLPLSRARVVLAVGFCLVSWAGMFGLLAWGLGKLNRAAAEKHLEPHAEELRRLLDDLRSESDEGREE